MKNKVEQAIVSYSVKHDMPLLANTAAVSLAKDILLDPTKVTDAVFVPDEAFVCAWLQRNDTDAAPTEQEMLEYVVDLITECREEDDAVVRKVKNPPHDDVPPFGSWKNK